MTIKEILQEIDPKFKLKTDIEDSKDFRAFLESKGHKLPQKITLYEQDRVTIVRNYKPSMAADVEIYLKKFVADYHEKEAIRKAEREAAKLQQQQVEE